MSEKQKKEYTSADIQYVSAVDHVRKRPTMYFGSLDDHISQTILFELVDHCLERAIEGNCDRISICLHPDNRVTVSYNGKVMLVQPEHYGYSELELNLCEIGIGGVGIRIATVNALSSTMTAEVRRDGKRYRQSYEKGYPVTGVESIGELEPYEATGMTFTFLLDNTILPAIEFDALTIKRRLHELSFVLSEVIFTLVDERENPPDERIFYAKNGLLDYVRLINRDRTPLHEVIHASQVIELTLHDYTYSVGFELALQYTDDDAFFECHYSNTIAMNCGGIYLPRFHNTLRESILTHFFHSEPYHRRISFQMSDFLGGLTDVFRVRHPEPQYQTKGDMTLMNEDFIKPMEQFIEATIERFARQHPADAARIAEKIQRNRQQRENRIYEVL